MTRRALAFSMAFTLIRLTLPGIAAAAMPWPHPVAPAIPGASGYVTIPGAVIPPDKARRYRAVFDATRAADRAGDLVPALDMVGSELNALGAAGVPTANARFVVVFHGAATVGILDDARYRARFGVPNPNQAVLTALKRAGVELYVCGQYLAAEGIDPATLVPEVRVAADALIVLMVFQNDGYAYLGF